MKTAMAYGNLPAKVFQDLLTLRPCRSPNKTSLLCRSEEENKLKFCGTCRMACYCGVECQQSDWKVHKLLHREIKNYAGSVMV